MSARTFSSGTLSKGDAPVLSLTASALSRSRREQLAQFGPNVLPLFYTARRNAPEFLEWEPLAPASAMRLIFGVPDSTEEITPIMTRTLPPGVHSCALSCSDLQPGISYAWRVEAEETGAVPIQEGRFWLLDDLQQARWKHGCRALSEGSDRDFIAIGLALYLAELELYQDALEIIKRGPSLSERTSRILLAHTAQALVYRQMYQNLQNKQRNDTVMTTLIPAFTVWAKNREQYHCSRANAQMTADSLDSVTKVTVESLQMSDARQIRSALRRRAA